MRVYCILMPVEYSRISLPIGDRGGTLITKIVMSLSKRGNRKALAGIFEFHKSCF